MNFSQYGITLETVGTWLILGTAFAFILKKFQKRFSDTSLPIKSALMLAMLLSVVFLFLLLLGFVVTIVAVLSFGAGILFYLLSRNLKNIMLFLLLGRSIKPIQKNS